MNIRNALVVHNKPLYEIHILEEKNPYFLRLLKTQHPTTRAWKRIYEEHHRALEGVRRTLSLLGIETQVVFRKNLKKIETRDLVVTVGGDGTFLETSHFLTRPVLFGVNATPFDSIGALCRGRLDNFLSLLVDLISGELKPKKLARLRVKLSGKYLPYPALNEVLLANQSPAGTSRYVMRLGKTEEEHKSSGVWVATASGSTAAIRSAGGKPLPVDRPGMQFAVREIFPQKGMKFKLLRGILKKREKLVFYSKMRQGALFIDGNHIMVPVKYGEKIEISADAPPLRAVL
jgi:NAD+ kinase